MRGDEFGGKSKGLVLDLLGFRCLIRHPSGDSKWRSGHSLELKGECAQCMYDISIRMVLAEECTYMYNKYFQLFGFLGEEPFGRDNNRYSFP